MAGNKVRLLGFLAALLLAWVLLPSVVVADGSVATPSDAAGDNATATGAALQVTHTYNLTRNRTGEVTVRAEYDIRSGNASPRKIFDSERIEVLSTHGFVERRRFGRTVYRWDGRTENPHLVAKILLGRSDEEADYGNWAFFDAFGTPSQYNESPRRSFTIDANVPVANGKGPFVFLGEHEVRTRTVEGQTIRLVAPRAAMTASPPYAILNTLARTAKNLDVGGRDHDRITAFVAPRPIRRGGATDPSSDHFWASAQDGIQGTTTWPHEYVHTRQEFLSYLRADWVTEGFAEFYGSRMTWQVGEYDFGDFRRTFLYPERADQTLSNRSEWDRYTPYTKGAAVTAALDYRIRKATGGRRSLQDVFARLNDRKNRTDRADLKRIAERVADRQFDRFFRRYVEGDKIPTPPSDPSVYPFLETRSATGYLQSPTGSARGQVIVFTDREQSLVGTGIHERINWFEPEGIDTLRERILATTYTSRSVTAGSVEVAVERGYSYDTAYLQYESGRVAFPTDGVPDLYALGGVSDVRGDVQLPQGYPVSVGVVGGNATDVTVWHENAGSEVGVTLPTQYGELDLPGMGASDDLELTGEVGFRAGPTGHRVSTEVYAPTDVLLRATTGGESGVAGSAVPGGNLTAGHYAPITAFVYNDGGEATTVSVPVYVDGERVTTRRIAVQPKSTASTTATVLLETSGVHRVRVGDLPPQRVRVVESGGGGGGGDGNGTGVRVENGSLGEGEDDTYTVPVGPNVDRVVIELTGPADADFDLFATLDGRTPGRYDYDRKSWSPNANETIRLSAEELNSELGVLVDSYRGSGNYTLRVVRKTASDDSEGNDTARGTHPAIDRVQSNRPAIPTPSRTFR